MSQVHQAYRHHRICGCCLQELAPLTGWRCPDCEEVCGDPRDCELTRAEHDQDPELPVTSPKPTAAVAAADRIPF